MDDPYALKGHVNGSFIQIPSLVVTYFSLFFLSLLFILIVIFACIKRTEITHRRMSNVNVIGKGKLENQAGIVVETVQDEFECRIEISPPKPVLDLATAHVHPCLKRSLSF